MSEKDLQSQDASVPQFYDEQDVFERYMRFREWKLTPNSVMEEPALLDVLGSVQGLRIADLGCGDAAFGRTLLEAGCRSYLGIDNSAKMVAAARETLRGTTGEVVRQSMSDFSASESFDLIVSRLAFHYVPDLRGVLDACRTSLVRSGRLVFTVVHPVVTSHEPRESTNERRTNWVVDDYFVSGPRKRDWFGGTTIWYHRTLEEYMHAVQGTGFQLSDLRECQPVWDRFDGDREEFERRKRVPLILLIAATRA